MLPSTLGVSYNMPESDIRRSTDPHLFSPSKSARERLESSRSWLKLKPKEVRAFIDT